MLFWQAEEISPLAGPFRLRLHDESNTLVTEWPFNATEGRHPPEKWGKGELIRDPQTRFLPGNLAPATYQLILSNDEREALVGELIVK